jgi:hypothetical protein
LKAQQERHRRLGKAREAAVHFGDIHIERLLAQDGLPAAAASSINPTCVSEGVGDENGIDFAIGRMAAFASPVHGALSERASTRPRSAIGSTTAARRVRALRATLARMNFADTTRPYNRYAQQSLSSFVIPR